MKPRRVSAAQWERERRRTDLANALLIQTLRQLGVDTDALILQLVDEYRLMPSVAQQARNAWGPA